MSVGETTITIVGNLTADPEIRVTNTGTAVASFTIASTPRTFDKATGTWKDGDALFLRCSAWRELGEHAGDSLTKGQRVIATGRLKQRSYDDREGVKRTVVELDVEEVGPSLRFATAKVVKATRTGTGTSVSQGEADPWASAAPDPATLGDTLAEAAADLRPEVYRPRTAWTAAELMATDFPPPRWAVPGLICEGVTLLTGPPKVGKSWLSLGLAMAVATSGQALGRIPVQQGPVLYLALEDTARRLKSRLSKVLADTQPPGGLTLVTECAPFPAGAAELALWLDEHTDARLIIIDVLAKVRAAAAPGIDPYQADYAAIGRFKALASARLSPPACQGPHRLRQNH